MPNDTPPGWSTPAELDAYRSTPDYAETLAFVERLATRRPDLVRVESFGRSGEGRELKVAIASQGGLFEPERVRSAGRVVLLVQNCIHAGEPDGKDACLALLRDIVVRDDRPLPENVVLLVVPVYNVDGHERRSPYNRINQNGPTPAGWRANGTNLNLNRDYLKAEAPETRAFLRLFHRWLPDFFVDDHVTDGADYQYDVTFQLDSTPNVYAPTARWIRESVVPRLVQDVDAAGHLAFPTTIFLNDEADPSQGIAFNENPPRFSTGRVLLDNRPALLVEMHMLKDYATRVRGNHELLRSLLGILARDAGVLSRLNREADDDACRLGAETATRPPFPLVVGGDVPSSTITFRGRAFVRFDSDVSGGPAIRYLASPWEPVLGLPTVGRVDVSVRPPAAYVIPPQWTSVIEVLLAQGLRLRRTASAWTGTVEMYRCSGMRWPDRPFEGRFPILRGGNVERSFGLFGSCVARTERTTFPPQSAVVPLDQRLSKVAIHWLEPEAPDSALRWGFFNSIFERKESAEEYVLEELARSRLEKDPALRADFQSRLASDPEFVRDASARLEYFWERSPWAEANRVGNYPVGRLSSLEGLPLD